MSSIFSQRRNTASLLFLCEQRTATQAGSNITPSGPDWDNHDRRKGYQAIATIHPGDRIGGKVLGRRRGAVWREKGRQERLVSSLISLFGFGFSASFALIITHSLIRRFCSALFVQCLVLAPSFFFSLSQPSSCTLHLLMPNFFSTLLKNSFLFLEISGFKSSPDPASLSERASPLFTRKPP
jgi:hypothetical protein